MSWQMIVAGVTFLLVYAIIVSEKIHRTVIALTGAALLLALGVLTQEEAVHFIDFNTIGLLFGMMVVVGITKKSGVFEYVAIKSVHMVRGEPVRILVALSVVTALASALLDNVTTVLLIVPITLSVCHDLDLSPVPFFFSEILASNIGGTSTLIGDPPNIMIGSAAGYGFVDFLRYDAPVVMVVFVVTVAILAFIFRGQLKTSEELKARIMERDPREVINDQALLKKSLAVITLVIAGFALHQFLNLESATIAIAGAAVLLLITREDPEEIFHTVEWPTLFFFIGLFILVGGLEKVGIISMLARAMVDLTHGNMLGTTMLILWFSAIASAFVDNIPFVATFIPLIKDIGVISHSNIAPLWWALSLGACLGGNGTIIGASANVVVSGMAAREGHPMSFVGFMKLAFPLMILSILICTAYLYLVFF